LDKIKNTAGNFHRTLYRFSVWFGLLFLGWLKVKDYDYARFSGRGIWMVAVKIDSEGRIHQAVLSLPKDGLDIEKLMSL